MKKNTEKDGCNIIVLYNGNRFKKRGEAKGGDEREWNCTESRVAD